MFLSVFRDDYGMNDLACVLFERPCLMPVFSEIISVEPESTTV